MTPFIDATERAYREISAAKPATPAREAPTKEAEITRAEVEEILTQKRSASPELLQRIIQNARRLALSTFQKDNLGLQLSIAVAAKMREARGIKEDPSSRFFTEVLRMEDTPFGLLDSPDWFKEELRTGTRDIENCQKHRPGSCSCWASSRSKLNAVLRAFGERSPEGFTALKTWRALEQVENSAVRAGMARAEP